MKKIICLLIVTLLLISCNETDKSESIELTGIVLNTEDSQLYLTTDSGPYYAHTDDLDISDIDLGDTVTVGYDGMVMESYPMQIEASEILEVEKGNGLEDLSGKVVDVEENSVKIESSGDPYVVHFDQPILFDENTDEVIEEGDQITVTYNGEIMESYPMQIKGLLVKVDEKEPMITIDKRESVSGIIGSFPVVIVSDQVSLRLNDIFAVELPGGFTYEIEKDLLLEQLPHGYGSQESFYYYGFIGSVKGEHVIKFKQYEGDELIQTIEINIKIR